MPFIVAGGKEPVHGTVVTPVFDSVSARCWRSHRQDGPQLWPSLGEYPLYDPVLYRMMTGDTARNASFNAALRRRAPGRFVIDIGAGQDLNWSRASHAYGARRVMAIEQSHSAALRARELLSCDPCRGLELVESSSFDVTLRERADLVVSETLGSIASAEGAVAILSDARRRLLKPAGRVVPDRACTMVALASTAGLISGEAPVFAAGAPRYLRALYSLAKRSYDVRLCVVDPDQRGVLTGTGEIETMEFNHPALGVCHAWREVSVNARADGSCDAALLWLRFWADEGDRPVDTLERRTSWGAVLAPFTGGPVRISRGDRLRIRMASANIATSIAPDYALSVYKDGPGSGFGALSAVAALPHLGCELRQSPVHRQLLVLH